MRTIILTSLLLLTLQQRSSAQSDQYQVVFDTGQTAISLAQLDSIKALVRTSNKSDRSSIRVVAYAHDAKKGDTNEQLSRRRAYLIQQCLERENIPLSRLHIQNIVCDATVEVCIACANLSLVDSDGSRPRNSYSQRNHAFLYQQTATKSEYFWINPSEDNYVESKDGVLIYLPANTLVTTYNSPVKLALRVLENTTEQWWNGLATATSEGDLSTHKSIHLQATQDGALLPTTLRYPLTLVLPNQDSKPQQWSLWQKTEHQWTMPSIHSSTALFLGDFYSNKNSQPCEPTSTADIYAPNYGAAPQRPSYIQLQEATALQDAAIAALEERLQPLEALRYDKGKKEIWTKQQEQRAYQLKNQKDLLLVTRERIRREAQNKNVLLEETYYRTLGQYNQYRHQLQTTYVQALEKRARQLGYQGLSPNKLLDNDRCAALQYYQPLLKAAYDSVTYKALQQRLEQLSTFHDPTELSYWIKSDQLGWLALGRATKKSTTSNSQFFAQGSASPYKITAFYHQQDGQIIAGQAQEDGRLAFSGIDPSQEGTLLAVLEKEGEFWVALQLIGGNDVSSANKTVGLHFKYRTLAEALQQTELK